MKFVIERQAFIDAGAWVAKSLSRRPQIPLRSAVKLNLSGDILEMVSFDGDISRRCRAKARAVDNDGASGVAVVSGPLLAQIVKALPSESVEVTIQSNKLEMVSGRAQLVLPTMPPEQHFALPPLPKAEGALRAADLRSAVTRVGFAASRGETSPELNGVQIEANQDKLSFVATNRCRLAVQEIDWHPECLSDDFTALIERRLLNEAAKAFPKSSAEVVIGRGDNSLGLTCGDKMMTVALLDLRFPKWRSLFPAAHKTEVVAPATELLKVVRQVSLMAVGSTPIQLSVGSGELVIQAGNQNEGLALNGMSAQVYGEEKKVQIAAQSFLDCLSKIDTRQVKISFGESTDPTLIVGITEEGRPISPQRYLVMPISPQ